MIKVHVGCCMLVSTHYIIIIYYSVVYWDGTINQYTHTLMQTPEVTQIANKVIIKEPQYKEQ